MGKKNASITPEWIQEVGKARQVELDTGKRRATVKIAGKRVRINDFHTFHVVLEGEGSFVLYKSGKRVLPTKDYTDSDLQLVLKEAEEIMLRSGRFCKEYVKQQLSLKFEFIASKYLDNHWLNLKERVKVLRRQACINNDNRIDRLDNRITQADAALARFTVEVGQAITGLSEKLGRRADNHECRLNNLDSRLRALEDRPAERLGMSDGDGTDNRTAERDGTWLGADEGSMDTVEGDGTPEGDDNGTAGPVESEDGIDERDGTLLGAEEGTSTVESDVAPEGDNGKSMGGDDATSNDLRAEILEVQKEVKVYSLDLSDDDDDDRKPAAKKTAKRNVRISSSATKSGASMDNCIDLTVDSSSNSEDSEIEEVPLRTLDDEELVRRHIEKSTQSNLRYSLQQFKDMWKEVENDLDHTTEELESSQGIRKGNHRLEKTDSVFQAKAQYGRLKFEATDDLLKNVLKLNPSHDVFIDIGSGIANTVAQAAYEFQCDARGIEVVSFRDVVGQQFLRGLNCLHKRQRERDYKIFTVGDSETKVGRLEDPQQREFLTRPGPERTTIKAFCNNFNGVFADNSAKAGDQNIFMFLDHFIAGLLPAMPPASILLTFYPLPISILPRSKVIKARRGSGLISNDAVDGNASFYEMEEIELGYQRHAVTWASDRNEKPLVGYKYTRLAQPYQGNEDAVFLCCNPHCAKAQQATPMGVTHTVTRRGTNETGIVLEHGCDCNGVGEGMTLRNRTRAAKSK